MRIFRYPPVVIFASLLSLNEALADAPAGAAGAPSKQEKTSTLSPSSEEEPGPDDPRVKLIEQDRLDGQSMVTAPFALGLSPVPNAGLGMGLGFRWRDIAFSGEGRILFPLGLSHLPGGHNVAMFVGVGLLSVCSERLRPLFFCAVVEGGRLIDPINTEGPRLVSHSPFFAAPAMRLGGVYGFANGTYLRVFMEPAFMLVGPRITTNEMPVWTMPPVTIVLGVELTGLVSSYVTHRNRWPETLGWGAHPRGWGNP